MENYKIIIQKAAEAIDNSRLAEAKILLTQAVGENVTGPESYNLLGILAEYQGDYALAAKFYRASYAFDPTFRPADKNLERITMFSAGARALDADHGLAQSQTLENNYYVEYDERHIGHIRKKAKQ